MIIRDWAIYGGGFKLTNYTLLPVGIIEPGTWCLSSGIDNNHYFENVTDLGRLLDEADNLLTARQLASRGIGCLVASISKETV